MAVEAVVFDFDGLMMDTETTMLASWQHEWRWHGLELDSGSFFADHGGDVSEAGTPSWPPPSGRPTTRPPATPGGWPTATGSTRACELLPGIADWLSQAARLGIRLAVATSSPRGWASRHLGGHGSLAAFEFLACGDEVARAKPDPGVYLLALERLGLPADRVVAVEDSPHGVAAAQAAGLRCVAIPNPHADPARFATADLLLSSAGQLPLDELLRTLEPSRNHRP